jgi:hypothetical protein
MRILKIESLPNSKTWLDRDLIMLHACFQILKDCVEKENIDLECSEEGHKDFYNEVRFLYQWWKERVAHDDDSQDDEMLFRLMKIRNGLWT